MRRTRCVMRKVAKLREECVLRSLDTMGSKAALVQRLTDADASSSAAVIAVTKKSAVKDLNLSSLTGFASTFESQTWRVICRVAHC